MWEHTLMVLSADNGGPVYPSLAPDFPHCGGANNYPLFGGKASNWEGGVRTSAFVSGGFVPPAVRGSKLEKNIHMADWYATFCNLAGVDASDIAPGVPGVDSMNMWPLLIGADKASPRYEIPLSIDFVDNSGNNSALIMGEYKLLTGVYPTSIRQQQDWPTNDACCSISCWERQQFNCDRQEGGACLFNIQEDPTETKNLAATKPEVVKRMLSRIGELRKTVFRPQAGDEADPAATEAAEKYGGWVGPWLDLPDAEQIALV